MTLSPTARSGAPIKAVLLDQSKAVCGVGNWIADEVRIISPPSTPAHCPDVLNALCSAASSYSIILQHLGPGGALICNGSTLTPPGLEFPAHHLTASQLIRPITSLHIIPLSSSRCIQPLTCSRHPPAHHCTSFRSPAIMDVYVLPTSPSHTSGALPRQAPPSISGQVAVTPRGRPSHWREFCHSAAHPSPSLLKHLLKGEGGAAE